MLTIRLKGENLGKRHHHFNVMVTEAIKKKNPLETIILEYNDSDIDNLFKIDIASEYKDVDYILEVFKSEDMLYVSRAIKKSTWLITDQQYSHIINPQYLYMELFPHMTSKAICKLLLHIRLHLKQEARADEFYNYLEERNINLALKWLPNCSLNLIENVLERHSHKIGIPLFKRLCEKSYRVLEQFHKNVDLKKPYHKAAIFLLNNPNYTERFLRETKSLYAWDTFKFSKKHTKKILKNCSEIVFNDIFSYEKLLNVEILGRHLGKDNIKDFMLKNARNEKWFTYENISPLIKLLPKDDKFDFVKNVFINHSLNGDGRGTDNILIRSAVTSRGKTINSQQIYQWYNHAPFSIAFEDLKKLIESESISAERLEILKVMLATARRNINDIETVLQYYIHNYANDSIKCKRDFIKALLSRCDILRFNESCWKLLNDIFHIMEVYVDSENNVQICLETIIVYKLLHKESIPEIVIRKLKFTTFKRFKNKLKHDEREVIFIFLYRLIENKINNHSLQSRESMCCTITYLEHMLDLLSDWDKVINDFPLVRKKIKELLKLKQENELAASLEKLFYRQKSQRKYMFEESLLMSHTEGVCINALKHDPTLLKRYPDVIDIMRADNRIVLKRFLSKLKIYWPQTLAKDWASAYRNNVDESKGHQALIRGLCTILPHDELINLLEIHAPNDPKIVWNNVDDTILDLRKNFARLMYCSRPQPPPIIILSYSQGDYLQYALPSLMSIFNNLSSKNCQNYIPEFLHGPILLQKFALHLAYSKMNGNDITKIFIYTWNISNSPVVRAVIFQLTFKLLCHENNPLRVKEIWKTLKMFIDGLKGEENKMIYKLLGKVYQVPAIVRAEYCQKSYEYLKSLSPKENVTQIIHKVVNSTANLMDSIDPVFVQTIILEFTKTLPEYLTSSFSNYHYEIKEVIVAYLLCTKDKNIQNKRYKTVFIPIIFYCIENWSLTCGVELPVKMYFTELLAQFLTTLQKNFMFKNYVSPIKVFKKIKDIIETRLSVIKNYEIITTCKLLIALVNSYDKIRAELTDPIEQYDDNRKTDFYFRDDKIKERFCQVWPKMAPHFAKDCKKLLKEDLKKYFPSVQILFNQTLEDFIRIFTTINRFDRDHDIELGKALVKDEDDILVLLTALHVLPVYVQNKEKYEELKQIRRDIMKHPSNEVQVHCCKKFFCYPEP